MITDDDGVILESPTLLEENHGDRPVAVVPFLRTPYNYDRDLASVASGLFCADVTLAQQHFKDECDINTIVKNFGLTGQLPNDLAVPQSGDFLDAMDFHSAMNVVRASEEAFMQMPADVRARFANDPGRFLDFVNDDANRDEARKMGILVPEAPAPKAPEPMLVRVVPDEKTSST